jgi:hypothetical protein
MSYSLKTDNEIIADLAAKLDELRRQKRLRDEDLVSQGGTNRVVLNKFRSGSGITLKSFIRLLRGIHELDALEQLLTKKEVFYPTASPQEKTPKRIHKKKGSGPIVWGEDKGEA